MRTAVLASAELSAAARGRAWGWTAQPTLEELGFEAIGDELRAELEHAARALPRWRRPRVALVVREDGVAVIERDELATYYRRAGLHDLARRVKAADLGRLLVALEGEPVTELLTVDAAAWLGEDHR